ncbi:hypothetical protein NDU88_005745 [Pleurodeles waltl]|uniref:Uncharacterized protein n=1 Tax=Pleurodeles waltl TaxID=8319 RepID=A0AAV7MC66_PLEWA|nr:hypothetical protein NDU88_005745 [Pleurodeles waltl]
MEPNKVVMALKVLQEEGREDLIKEGLLEEAWVGLKRPKRRSAGGVSAAVAACSSPKSGKKFKTKSVEGRKVSRSPDLEVVDVSVPPGSSVVSRGRQRVCLPRRQGSSLLQRVSAGGRGVPLKPAVARAGRMGVRPKGARAQLHTCAQARSPIERGVEQVLTADEERSLAGASKMAAPMILSQSMPALEKNRAGKPVMALAPGVQVSKELVIKSDEEEDVHKGAGSVAHVESSGRWGFQGQRCNRFMQWIPRVVSPMLHRVQSWEVGNQAAVHLGEQIELVDDSGAVFKGTVCGEAGSSGALGRAYVSLDFWQPDRGEGTPGCDTSHVLGGRGVQVIYRRSGWMVGDQSLPVKVRAPSEHRHEGRVRSGGSTRLCGRVMDRMRHSHPLARALVLVVLIWTRNYSITKRNWRCLSRQKSGWWWQEKCLVWSRVAMFQLIARRCPLAAYLEWDGVFGLASRYYFNAPFFKDQLVCQYLKTDTGKQASVGGLKVIMVDSRVDGLAMLALCRAVFHSVTMEDRTSGRDDNLSTVAMQAHALVDEVLPNVTDSEALVHDLCSRAAPAAPRRHLDLLRGVSLLAALLVARSHSVELGVCELVALNCSRPGGMK